MFHLSQFFSTNDLSKQAALVALPPFPSQIRHCLITGPEHSGKSSALFHFAHSLAASGKSVYIVCQKAKLEQQPPLLPEGVSSTDPAFSRVHIRYLASSADLQKFAACLHLLQDLPEAILIDDICSFAEDRGYAQHDRRLKESELVKVLALLHEAVNAARMKSTAQQGHEQANSRPCLVVTESQESSAKFLYVLKRWLPLHLAIRETGTEYSMSVLPESARALGLPQDNMAEVAFSVLPYSSISLTAVRPSSELGISPERHAQAHTIAVMQ